MAEIRYMNYTDDIFPSNILLESVYRMTNDLPSKSAGSFFPPLRQGDPCFFSFKQLSQYCSAFLSPSLFLCFSLFREREKECTSRAQEEQSRLKRGESEIEAPDFPFFVCAV